MFKNKILTKTSNPQLKKLTLERGTLSTEVKELSQDLVIIKQLLRQKQSKLRDVNSALLQKTMRGPFLSVVPEKNTSIYCDYTEINKHNKLELHCIDGGKSEKVRKNK